MDYATLFAGIGIGVCIGVQWCLWLRRRAVARRWPYRER